MLIKVNTDGLLVVPLINPKGELVTGRDSAIALCPGWNEIPVGMWSFAEPHLEEAIASGKVELNFKEVDEVFKNAEGKDEVRTIRQEKRLHEVRADIARKIVEGCLNFRDLERWKDDVNLTSELRALADITLGKIAKVS